MAKYKLSENKLLKVKRSASGLGVFTKQDIPKGKFVVEYTGELLPARKFEERDGKYLFEINSRWFVDGKDRKNLGRYVNHSCRPNCEVKISNKKILIYSLRKIKSGEELNYDYGKEYFNEFIKPHGCRCQHCTKK